MIPVRRSGAMVLGLTLTLLAVEPTDLLRAAHEDDLAAVRQLLAAGADAKAANRYGVTPIALAAANGNAAMIELLLQKGADANTRLASGETILMTAARTGKLAAVQSLLKAGADVNARESTRQQTALMWAAAEGHAGTVEALLAAGAQRDVRLASGYNAFLFAVREGKIAAVRMLLTAGANVNDTIQPTGAGGRILGGGAARAQTSALILATLNGHYELGKVLLEAGANPNAMESGWTALHAVNQARKPGLGDNNPSPIGSGNLTSLDFVRVLHQHGADLNARMTKKIAVGMTSLNTTGATAFCLAARSADAELMRLLASLGADPKLPTADGATPLIVAAGLGTRSPGEDAGAEAEVIEAVKVALELGNDINAVDKNGETAMHGAAYKNLPGVVALLAARGADPAVWNKPNKQGWTPLRIAEGYRFGNYKPSPVTMAAFHQVMKAAGLE